MKRKWLSSWLPRKPNFTVTDRGFKHFEPIPTDYGHTVRIYESSAAMAPHIWLQLRLTEEVGGIKPEEATAHLSIDQAKAVRDALDSCIKNHYQLDGN